MHTNWKDYGSLVARAANPDAILDALEGLGIPNSGVVQLSGRKSSGCHTYGVVVYGTRRLAKLISLVGASMPAVIAVLHNWGYDRQADYKRMHWPGTDTQNKDLIQRATKADAQLRASTIEWIEGRQPINDAPVEALGRSWVRGDEGHAEITLGVEDLPSFMADMDFHKNFCTPEVVEEMRKLHVCYLPGRKGQVSISGDTARVTVFHFGETWGKDFSLFFLHGAPEGFFHDRKEILPIGEVGKGRGHSRFSFDAPTLGGGLSLEVNHYGPRCPTLSWNTHQSAHPTEVLITDPRLLVQVFMREDQEARKALLEKARAVAQRYQDELLALLQGDQ